MEVYGVRSTVEVNKAGRRWHMGTLVENITFSVRGGHDLGLRAAPHLGVGSLH